MDADNSPGRAASSPRGGVVEPANRAAVAIDKHQTPHEAPSERYELRDPFADTTYRATSFAEMAAKADQIGSNRFTAIAADDTRTPVVKKDGEWHRGAQLQPLPQRPLDPGPAREGGPEDGAAAKTQASKPLDRPEQIDDKAMAKIDAQADRSALVARLEEALKDRYVIKRAPVKIGDVSIGRTEYRFRGDSSRVAFTESTFKLATDTNSPSVARSMVDVAQTRNWKGLRVSGSEDFRRMVWLEASVRGVKAIGYEPNPADMDVLRREQQARLTNRIEPTHESVTSPASTPSEKSSARGGGGRKAVVAAIEAVLVAKKVPEAQRNAVLAAATEKLAERKSRGEAPKVKVYDKAAQPERPISAPTHEANRSRDRATPTHVR